MKNQRMKGLEQKVRKILEVNERARGDDAVLYCDLLNRYYDMELDAYSAEWFVLNCRKLGLPSMESIGRFRRLVQSKHEELKPTEEIQVQRKIYEKTFFDYMKRY